MGDLKATLHVPSTIALLGLGIVIGLMYFVLSPWYRLRHIPGPPSTGFSSWWLLRGTLGGTRYLELHDAIKKYGPVIQIAPDHVAISDPDVVRRIWAVRSPYIRGETYEATRFDPTRDNIVSMRDEAKHSTLRTKMAAGYAGKANDGLEPAVDSIVLKLMDLVDRKYISSDSETRTMDLARKAQYFTLDSISTLLFGEVFGFLEADSDVHRYIEIIERSLPSMMALSLFPYLVKLLQSPLGRWMMPSDQDVVGFGSFIAIINKVVTARIASGRKDPKDMLDSFLAQGLDPEEAKSEVLAAVLGGSDTTATAISATMLHLMTSPSVYLKLKREVHSALEQGRISSPVVMDTETRNLPYLQAVIKEGLRIFPPAPALLSSQAPKGGDTINGLEIPESTQVSVAMWSIVRDKSVFGPDAELFRPERWLEAGKEKLQRMSATHDLIFKAGKWHCLGRNIASMELNKAVFEFFRRYDMLICNPTKPWHAFEAGPFCMSDFWVKVTDSKGLSSDS